MSLPNVSGRRHNLSALSVLGLGCLLSISGVLHGQQPVQLNGPVDLDITTETPPPPIPPPVGDPTRTGVPAKGAPSTLPPPGAGVEPAEPPNSLPRPTELPPPMVEKTVDDHPDRVVVPAYPVELVVGIPQRVILHEKMERLQLGAGDDASNAATFEIVHDRELSLLGRQAGRTVLNIWFADAYGRKGQRKLIITVAPAREPAHTSARLPLPAQTQPLPVVNNRVPAQADSQRPTQNEPPAQSSGLVTAGPGVPAAYRR